MSKEQRSKKRALTELARKKKIGLSILGGKEEKRAHGHSLLATNNQGEEKGHVKIEETCRRSTLWGEKGGKGTV